MFSHEPALIATTIYLSVSLPEGNSCSIAGQSVKLLQFIGGCLYMMFEAYPIVFGDGHHMGSGNVLSKPERSTDVLTSSRSRRIDVPTHDCGQYCRPRLRELRRSYDSHSVG